MEDLIIENNIVKGCKEKYVVQINIPAGVKAVGDNAFRGLQKLYDINFPISIFLRASFISGAVLLRTAHLLQALPYQTWDISVKRLS